MIHMKRNIRIILHFANRMGMGNTTCALYCVLYCTVVLDDWQNKND